MVHPGDETCSFIHPLLNATPKNNKKCTKTLNDDYDHNNNIIHHARVVSVSVRFNNKLKKFPLLVSSRDKKEKAKKSSSYNK